MSNLPITNSAPQPAVSSKPAANSNETGDAQNNQPFGEVLARQISDPKKKDAKTDDTVAADAPAQVGSDAVSVKRDAIDIRSTDAKKDKAETQKSDPAATDGTTNLPANMLASLLPQAVNNAVAVNTSSGSADTRSDITASSSANEKRGVVALKTDVATAARTDVTTQAISARGSQAKEQAFATALTDSANRASANLALHASANETIPAQVGPQANAAMLAAVQNAAASIAAPMVQPVQVSINTPVNQDKWGDEFGQKITWLASSNKDQTAELHLNPPNLGPLDVVIKVSGDQATALFTSPHAAVRDAIEQAMPRLRDMMSDSGIMLGNATVSDQAPRDQGQAQSGNSRPSITHNNDILTPSLSGNTAARVSQISRHNGIVDTFA